MKEILAQCLQRSLFVFFANEEGDIMVGASVADHSQRDVAESFRGERLESRIAAAEVADDADDTHIVIHLYGADFLAAPRWQPVGWSCRW